MECMWRKCAIPCPGFCPGVVHMVGRILGIAPEPPSMAPTPSTTPKSMPNMSPGPVLNISHVLITPWGNSVLTGLSAAYLAHRSAWVASGTARVLGTRLQSCVLRGREQRRPTVCCRPVTAAGHCHEGASRAKPLVLYMRARPLRDPCRWHTRG